MADSIQDAQALRSLLGEPVPLVRAKVSDRLNDVTRRFVEALAVPLPRDRRARRNL